MPLPENYFIKLTCFYNFYTGNHVGFSVYLVFNFASIVGFKSSVHHTVAASRYVRQKEMPSMDELVNRHVEAGNHNEKCFPS